MNTSLFTDKNMLQLDLEQLVRAKEVKEEQKKLLLQKMKQLTTLRIFNDMDDREIAEIMVRSDGHDPQAAPGSAASYLCLGPISGYARPIHTIF